MVELLPLVALVVHEDPVHLVWHRRLDDLVLFQRAQGLAERHRQLLDLLAGFHGLVDVALLGLARIEVAVDAVVEGLQKGAGHQVGVHHGIDRAVLEPAGRRDAQRAGPVLIAPVGEDRRPETRVPKPAVGVDRGGADRGQGAQMLHHAADALQADRAGLALVDAGIGHEEIVAALQVGEGTLEARQ